MFKCIQYMKEALFKIARSDFSSLFIGFTFEHLTPLMPLDRVAEDPRAIAFYHPVKHWDEHIVIVPKQAIKKFAAVDFDNKRDALVLNSVFQIAQKAADEKRMDRYTLLVNGGQYQDVPQIHFHLAAGEDKHGHSLGKETSSANHRSEIDTGVRTVVAYKSLEPTREIDIVLSPLHSVNSLSNLDLNNKNNRQTLLDILRASQSLVRILNLPAYTLLTNELGTDKSSLDFHLVSGENLE